MLRTSVIYPHQLFSSTDSRHVRPSVGPPLSLIEGASGHDMRPPTRFGKRWLLVLSAGRAFMWQRLERPDAYRRRDVMPGFHTTASVCRRHRCQLFVALLCYGDLGSLFSWLGGETTHDVCAHKDSQLHSSGFHSRSFMFRRHCGVN